MARTSPGAGQRGAGAGALRRGRSGLDKGIEGGEVIVSVMEHHSNIVPWQLLAARKGIAIKVIPMNDKGELLLDEYEKLFSERTKIVSVVHVSNVLGTVNPVKEMIATAHAHGVPCLIDAAQSIPHMKVDVQELDADFLRSEERRVGKEC